jgi:hypothetical protein
MKGKGRCFTYWLNSGTKNNDGASPKKIKELRKEVKGVLSKKKWKKRKYFNHVRRKSVGSFDEATLSFPDDSSVLTGISLSDELSYPGRRISTAEESMMGSSRGDLTSGISDDDIFSGFDTSTHSDTKRTIWSEIKWEPELSRSDLVSAIHGQLSSLLWKCADDAMEDIPENREQLDSELLHYVDSISSLYDAHPFHSWDHACQVTLSAMFLVNEYHDFGGEKGLVDRNPFLRFITVVSDLLGCTLYSLMFTSSTCATNRTPLFGIT